MKKAIPVLCFVILSVCAVSGCFGETGTVPSIRETMQTETAAAFSFRNGIRWDMTAEQVRALENVPMTERSSENWSVMVTEDKARVSRFSADLVFMFYQGQLKMITYEFQSDGSALDYQYLLGALCSVYGESGPADGIIIKRMMDQIYPDRYRTEWIREGKMWSTGDGTHIFLYYFSSNAYAILYTCPALTVQNSEAYDINGL